MKENNIKAIIAIKKLWHGKNWENTYSSAKVIIIYKNNVPATIRNLPKTKSHKENFDLIQDFLIQEGYLPKTSSNSPLSLYVQCKNAGIELVATTVIVSRKGDL